MTRQTTKQNHTEKLSAAKLNLTSFLVGINFDNQLYEGDFEQEYFILNFKNLQKFWQWRYYVGNDVIRWYFYYRFCQKRWLAVF